MGRKVIESWEVKPPISAAAQALVDMIQPDKPRRKRRAGGKASIEAAIKDVDRRLVLKEQGKDGWEKLTATTLLNLWVWCHTEIYGVRPNLPPQQWERALMRIGKMARDEFDGDYTAFLAYVHWAWGREQGYEKYRRDNGQSRPPMGVYKLFGTMVLTDYRIEKARGNA